MTRSDEASEFTRQFREAAPYVHAHRGKTAVVAFGGEVVQSPAFGDFVNDLAMLHALGLRLVLVHGATPQVEARLAAAGAPTVTHRGRRITDGPALEAVKDAVGSLRVEIEGRLSMGLADSPMANARIRVASGNFVAARPVGILDGVDHAHTGRVRRVDEAGVRQRLDAGAIVLLSPLGYSLTGDVFNLRYLDVAAAAARALAADKLLLLVDGADPTEHLPRQMTLDRLRTDRPTDLPATIDGALDAAIAALTPDATGRVLRRAHLIDRRRDGGMLDELFTRDGTGTLLSAETYGGIRWAEPRDVAGILRLIRPLAEQGTLVGRPRALLERRIEDFVVAERDGLVIACAACHPFEEDGAAELAAVAVHPDYRHARRGKALLEFVQAYVRDRGLDRLFVLTTQAEHWFRERGFVQGTEADLPARRRARYDPDRGSLILVKPL